ncbi:hypothetical protein AMAG_03028 [Allomyces macrogynus ATCC 38327]|uniref:Uncharacterized protein n=1 Tax=Allomyces macrogynus (strain ATCC 38327) TaxID=578462 RepID=A0A0L0S4C6_ALLM3|nr:hypothetical protein AMAG_03028 [Allomyces macrogynus ATCC 38327]|eukprot:KNE57300.1 hypothetical protein AMAG_03028 [Allomyces macrogynus ATCC 38327]
MMTMDVEVEELPPAPVPAAPTSSSSSYSTPAAAATCLSSFPASGSVGWATPVPPPFQAPVTSSPAPWRIQSRAHANNHVDNDSDLGDDDDDMDDDPADHSGNSTYHHHWTRRRLLFPGTPTPPATRSTGPAPLPHTPTSSRRVKFAPVVRVHSGLSPPPYAPAVGLDDDMLAYGGDIDEPLDWRSTTPPLPPSSSPLHTIPLLSLEACFSMSPPRATPAGARRASVDTPSPSPTPWPWSHATPPPPPTGLPPPRARVPLVRTSPGSSGNALRQSKLTTYLATVKDRRTTPAQGGGGVVPPPRRINSSPPVLGVAKRALKRSPAASRGATAGASSRGSPSDRVGVERLARELQHGMRLTQ